MHAMFCEAKEFDQPLNNWNVSNVINMSEMFRNTKQFNQPLNDWNISNYRIQNMFVKDMFSDAKSFNIAENATLYINYNNIY